MPYAKKEDKAKQMRDYRKRQTEYHQMIVDHAKEIIATRNALLKIVQLISFTLNRTDLTDSEKIVEISKIPIPEEIMQRLKWLPKVVLA